MKELAILGAVIMYVLLIAFQHLLNWGYRNNDKNFPIVLAVSYTHLTLPTKA